MFLLLLLFFIIKPKGSFPKSLKKILNIRAIKRSDCFKVGAIYLFDIL